MAQNESNECEVCRTNEGAERSICDKAVVVCDTCRDWLTVRLAVEENALTRAQLATSDPEWVMASLADLETKYADLDHDGWLRRSIRSERAFVLESNHRYDEALDELRQLTPAFADDPHGFVTNQLAIASVLNKSGCCAEAIVEIKYALSLHDSIDPRAVLGILSAYARIADSQGWNIESEFRGIVDAAVAAWGIRIPEKVKSYSLKEIVLYAASMRMEAQRRYRALMKSLSDATGEAKAKLLDEYLDSEPVGFYRELAIRSFREQV